MFARQRLKSDVPVTSRIGWRAYQEHLSLQELRVRVLEPELPILHTDALVEFAVEGLLSPHLHGESRWRPFIKTLHVSERLAGDRGETYGDILIVPIVGIRCDERYDNQPVEFCVTVQHEVSSYRWNRNHYRVTCEHLQQAFEIIQLNKDGQLHDAP